MYVNSPAVTAARLALLDHCMTAWSIPLAAAADLARLYRNAAGKATHETSIRAVRQVEDRLERKAPARKRASR